MRYQKAISEIDFRPPTLKRHRVIVELSLIICGFPDPSTYGHCQ